MLMGTGRRLAAPGVRAARDRHGADGVRSHGAPHGRRAQILQKVKINYRRRKGHAIRHA